jgi:hypothetical protein
VVVGTYSDAVRLALDIAVLTLVEAVHLGLLSRGHRDSLALGSGHGGESAGNEDGGETHVDGFRECWY